jgi:tRNA-Thr(GGU) m(6)t(6)A37 methyltransferase TsaA
LRGVFATRSPSRPNPIGISVVRLNRVEGTILHVRDIDIVNGTPLLDIKPYVPKFDLIETVRIGWLEGLIKKVPAVKDDGRFKK